MDFSKAMKFGELKICLPHSKSMVFDSIDMTERLKFALDEFTDQDHLLCVGDPNAIALAAAIASSKNGGRFKVLKWNSKVGDYYEISNDISEKG